MHIIHVKMENHDEEDKIYLDKRLSSRFRTKQILPDLWVTFQREDIDGNYIDSDLISEDLDAASKKISIDFNHFVTEGNWRDTEFSLSKSKSDWLNEVGK